MDKYFSSLNKFLTSKVGAFFVILPFVKPAPELTGDFDMIFDVWKLFAALLIFICCARTIHKSSRLLYWIIGLQGVMLVSTIIQGADFKAAIVQALSVISICLYFDYFMRIDSRKAISTLMLPLVFMSILTALTMFIFYPEGMYTVGDESVGRVEHQNYLWGFDNSSIFNFIPGMYLLGLYALLTNKKKASRRTFIILLFISLAFLYMFSITAFLGSFALILIFVFLIFKRNRIKLFTTRNLMVLVIVLSLILLIGNNRIGILMDFSKATDKFYSIQARFNIWNLVIEWWQKSPIIGYGIEDKLLIADKIQLDHPHNYFMDVLYRGGILGIVMLIGMFIKLLKEKWSDSRLNAYSAIVIFVLLLIAQFDFYNDHYMFYPVFIVAVNCKDLIVGGSDEINNEVLEFCGSN